MRFFENDFSAAKVAGSHFRLVHLKMLKVRLIVWIAEESLSNENCSVLFGFG